MISPEFLLSALVLFLYAAGTAAIVVGTVARNASMKRVANWLAITGFVVHAISLVAGLQGHTWETISKGYFLQMLSWSMLLIYLFVWWKFKLDFLSALASPFALLIYLSSFKVAEVQSKLPESLSGLFFGLHIGTLFLSFGLMAMAFGAGVLFLHMERKIKTKEPLTGFRKDLPALSTFDRVNRLCVVWGFPLFTLGIVSGFVWAHPAWGKVITWDPKEIVSLAVWVMYALLFHQRVALGWQGRKPAVMVIWIFAVSVFSLIVVNVFIPTHHSFIQQ